MLNLAIKWDVVGKNPMRDVKLFREPQGRMRILSREEEKILISSAAQHKRKAVQLLEKIKNGHFMDTQPETVKQQLT